ncbi:MAG: putative sigma-54 modulation protein [Eubacteriales bacterium]|nr:putative sigma-54 modulation protein [Eubacteriales bacterium]MDN5364305.1 putative sigma-54 modulation protein [Eubacteriales bacterium]
MRINVRGKNIEVTPALKNYVEKRLSKLEKYLDGIRDVQVTLTVEREDHKVEVTMPLDGMILRGEEITGDMYASIDLVVEKLEKQIEKYKTRFSRKNRHADVKGKESREIIAKEEEEGEEEPRLVKTKRFPIKPMSVEEAILQMNLLGHSFFVFSNAETEQVNVLYRRRDGNYGLIEPELE